MAAVERVPSLIPERRARSPEVIDVDLLEDDSIQDNRPAQRRRLSILRSARPGVITIMDSDDEDEAYTGPSVPRSGQFNNRRLFSPPPPPQNNVVPPVPPLPRQLQSQRSLPMRRHPPPHPFGIVRPNEQPFPFEANIRAGNNQADDGPPPPLAAAPPSHHVPAMGLGGALIAMHRSNQDAHPRANHGPTNRARARRAPRVQSSWILPSLGDIFSGEFIPRRRSAVQEEDIIYPEDDNDDLFFDLLTSNADDYYFRNRALQNGRTLRHFEPDYKPAYTHPDKPTPGFTFDFAPSSENSALSSSTSVIVVDDSPGPSTSASSSSHNDDPNTILVCARCMDALVTGDSTTGAEHIRRKIWALRCGHLLDGKCIEELMKPASLAASTVDASRVADAKGKGKEVVSTEPLPLDKGKGKAIERSDSYDQLDFLSPLAPPESNSIRSRLRPRPHSTVSHAPHPPSDPASLSQRVTRQLPSQWQQTSRQQLVKGKGKGKAKTSLVEAENHWKCPVTGCAKVHTSLLVEGKWIMDDKAGAIAVYV